MEGPAARVERFHGQRAELLGSIMDLFSSPAEYRDLVFLSSGVDMSYSERPAMADAHMFDNVFAPPAAYVAFIRTGVWPDRPAIVPANAPAKPGDGSLHLTGMQVRVDPMAEWLGRPTKP